MSRHVSRQHPFGSSRVRELVVLLLLGAGMGCSSSAPLGTTDARGGSGAVDALSSPDQPEPSPDAGARPANGRSDAEVAPDLWVAADLATNDLAPIEVAGTRDGAGFSDLARPDLTGLADARPHDSQVLVDLATSDLGAPDLPGLADRAGDASAAAITPDTAVADPSSADATGGAVSADTAKTAGVDTADWHRPDGLTLGDALGGTAPCAQCIDSSCGAAATACDQDPSCVATLQCAFQAGCMARDAGTSMDACIAACADQLGLGFRDAIAVAGELTAVASCGVSCASTCGTGN